ncbi:MAG: hypothetical protein D3909_04020 [Candidatus Electrothrix sp. ATG1]|nr:hypothetical protein [Candidatus Electrothrix sp. ATG1]
MARSTASARFESLNVLFSPAGYSYFCIIRSWLYSMIWMLRILNLNFDGLVKSWKTAGVQRKLNELRYAFSQNWTFYETINFRLL